MCTIVVSCLIVYMCYGYGCNAEFRVRSMQNVYSLSVHTRDSADKTIATS